MLKNLVLSVMSAAGCAYAVFGISSFSLPTVLAQSTGCNSYWVNPSTEEEECLDWLISSHASQVAEKQQKELSGSVKVFEGRNGDKAYIPLNSIRKFNRYGQNRVHFSLTTFFEHMKVGGAVKDNVIFDADCNSYSMRVDSHYTYDPNNGIVDGMTYGTTWNSQYQTTAPSPLLTVQPGTKGYAAWEYVCEPKSNI
ncbi:MAG: hypothetical protein HWQ38_08125 [Nostoc sp. NMS7]|uniref:hypothetical protein n=1 Tax=Nostoc sp. NMS7 TaxID=2815391 RepID=UPI0025E7B708|nr:hypothetical protein [Nostoc sp. NMS7]MBN3946449.1 hypothetical protein [Nostoc sp. NMS7]